MTIKKPEQRADSHRLILPTARDVWSYNSKSSSRYMVGYFVIPLRL